MTADLQLVSIGASRESEVAGERVTVAVINLLRADPAWEFNRTETSEIRWCHDLALMVRSPRLPGSSGTWPWSCRCAADTSRSSPTYRVQLDGRSEADEFVVRE